MIDGTVFSVPVFISVLPLVLMLGQIELSSNTIYLKLDGVTTLSEVTIWPFRSREHSKDRNGRVSRDRDADRKDRVESRESRRDYDRDRDRHHDRDRRHDRDRDRDYDRSRGHDSRRDRSRSREHRYC
jgi:hypothetical protein